MHVFPVQKKTDFHQKTPKYLAVSAMSATVIEMHRNAITCVIVHLFVLHGVRSHDETHNCVRCYTPVAWDSAVLKWEWNVCLLTSSSACVSALKL